jgi:taurine dioxygenase
VSESYLNRPSPDAGLDIVPVAGRIGAEIRGVRLSGELDGRTVSAIMRALARHKVVFFRGQEHLDDCEHEAFAARLGDLMIPSSLVNGDDPKAMVELDALNGGTANVWHTDVTFVPEVPAASVLRAVVIPEAGGDTLWANCAAAYAELPSSLRALADQMRAVHSNAFGYAAKLTPRDEGEEPEGPSPSIPDAMVYETEHPLVRVHPQTGERSLLVGHYAIRIPGLGKEEWRRMLAILQDAITEPENTVRWRWRPGDVAIWDNRSTQHRVIDDFGDQRRVMRRVTLAGTVPVGVDGRASRMIREAPIAAAAG